MPRRSGRSARPFRMATAASSQDADKNSDSDSLELPGFFYDPEKKRYFKWSPQVRERAQALQAAEQRRQEVATKKSCSAPCKRRSIKTLVCDRSYSCGPATPQAFMATVCNTMVATLECAGKDRTVSLHKPCDINQLHFIGSCNSNRRLSAIVAVTRAKMNSFALQISYSSEIGLGNFEPFHDTFILQDLVRQSVLMLPEQSTRGGGCSAEVAGSELSNPAVSLAYTTTSFDMVSKLYVQPLPMERYADVLPAPTSCTLGRGAARGCAYEARSCRMAVGLEKHVVVCSCQSGSPEKIRKIPCDDVCAVDFCPRDEGVLYVCNWAGRLHRHDLRESRPAVPFLNFLQETPLTRKQRSGGICCEERRVGCIRALQNLPHVVVSYTDGGMALWDIRSNKVVCHYEGNPGKYYGAVPFHLDESEQFICAGRIDGAVHIWDVVSGGQPLAKLLLPRGSVSPRPTVVAFTTLFGDPLVLAGTGSSVTAFSYSGDSWSVPE